MISFSVSVYLSPIASSEVSSVQVEEVPGGLQGKAETLQVLCVRHCPRFQIKSFVVAILFMTLQCALKEEILINYFFRSYLFDIYCFEIICKDLD